MDDITVIGAGPAGILLVASLLQEADLKNLQISIVWFDEYFEGGMLADYALVPSNTKYTTLLTVFQAYGQSGYFEGRPTIADGNCVRLGTLRSSLCELQKHLCTSTVKCVQRKVNTIDYHKGTWFVDEFNCKKVFLCTGSHPKTLIKHNDMQEITLKDAFNPAFWHSLHKNDCLKVAIVGGSHSAMLAVMLAEESDVPFVNFRRHKTLIYAQELPDGRFINDDSGLKGPVAEWTLKNSWPEVIVKDACEIDWHGFTHVVWAVGFERNSLPSIEIGNTTKFVTDYDRFGRLLCDSGVIPGLYGYGIAFPQKVIDPSGEPAEAVGLSKFARYFTTHPWSAH